MNLSGLSQVGAGFQQAQGAQQEIQMRAMQLKQAQQGLDAEKQRLASSAAAFQGLLGGAPGGGIGAQQPPQVQPPMPGQASVPMQQPGARPPQGAPGGQPGPSGPVVPAGGPAQPGQGPAPTAQPPQGGPAIPGSPPAGQPGGGAPGGQQIQPAMQILQNIAKQISQQNPGIDPATAMDAVKQQVEMMRGVEPDVKNQISLLADSMKMQIAMMKAQSAEDMLKIRQEYLDRSLLQRTDSSQQRDATVRRGQDLRAAMEKGEPISPEEKASLAGQAATGEPLNQVAPGYGKAATAIRQEARRGAIQQIQTELGVSSSDAGRELARRNVMYQAGKSSTQQLDKMLGATKQAVGQLDYNIKKAKEDMAKLPSTNLLPVLNAIARGEQKWTGDPAYNALFFDMQAVANESARILNGGQGSVAQLAEGAREEAQKWANSNMTPAQFDSVAENMLGEGQARLQTFEQAMKGQTPGGEGQPGAPAPAGDKGNVIRYDAQGNRVQ